MSALKLIVALCVVHTSLGIAESVGKSKTAGLSDDGNYTADTKSVRLTPVLEFEEDWKQWTTDHHKVFSDVRERVDKYAVWRANKEYIDQHNQNAQRLGYTLKMNKFGDLTTKEFIEGIHCVQDYQPTNASHLNKKHNTHAFVDYGDFVRGGAGEGVRGVGDMPETMDWRTSGVVTKVKDQLRCGSSYAFSAMASLEGINALSYGSLVTLSEQNIVDCSVTYGNHGCACGDVNRALLYVIENDGVDTWKGYPSGGDPYRSKQYSCKYERQYRGASARGIVSLASGDENTLLTAVANSGPVSVYVDATSTSFQFYSDGVLNVPYCSSSTLSHALVVIGYGKYSGQDYWLVKNSWGPNWGVRGYGKLARNKGNKCGIATAASFPTL
uniref:Silicatein beta n=1 Tax=Suberites domuncula TaxID=55567 RepID=Q50IU7_SUBDO|nr:silicatein beta [Suberites domuncula]CAH05007.1 silicatein-B protein SILICAbge_SUBDO [Suberites domuncula]CAI46304.1 silicatein beta [Suberites domuncula]